MILCLVLLLYACIISFYDYNPQSYTEKTRTEPYNPKTVATINGGIIHSTRSHKRGDRPLAVDHPLRLAIVRYLEEHVIAHFNELWRAMGVSKATLSWHLSVLEKSGSVKSIRYSKYLLYYVTSRASAPTAIAVLASKKPRLCKIIEYIRKGKNVDEIARELKLSKRGLESIYNIATESSIKPCKTTTKEKRPGLPD